MMVERQQATWSMNIIYAQDTGVDDGYVLGCLAVFCRLITSECLKQETTWSFTIPVAC